MDYSKIKEISRVLVERGLVEGRSALVPNLIIGAADSHAAEKELRRGDGVMDDACAALLSYVSDNFDRIVIKGGLPAEELQDFVKAIVLMARPNLAGDIPE